MKSGNENKSLLDQSDLALLETSTKEFLEALEINFPADALNNNGLLINAFKARESLRHPDKATALLKARESGKAGKEVKDFDKLASRVLEMIEKEGAESKFYDKRAIVQFKEDFYFTEEQIANGELKTTDILKCEAILSTILTSIQQKIFAKYLASIEIEKVNDKTNALMEQLKERIKGAVHEKVRSAKLFQLHAPKLDQLSSRMQALIDNAVDTEQKNNMQEYKLAIEQSKSKLSEMNNDQIKNYLEEQEKRTLFFQSYQETFDKFTTQISTMVESSDKQALINDLNATRRFVWNFGENGVDTINDSIKKLTAQIEVYQVMKPKIDELIGQVKLMHPSIIDTEMKQYWNTILSNLEKTSNSILTGQNIDQFILDIQFQIDTFQKYMPDFDKLISTLKTMQSGKPGNDIKNDLQIILNDVNKTKNRFLTEMDGESVKEFIKMKTDEIELYKNFPKQAHELSQLRTHMTTMMEVIDDSEIKQNWQNEINEIRSKLSTLNQTELDQLINDKKSLFYKQIPTVLTYMNNEFYNSLERRRSELQRKCEVLALIENTDNTEHKSKIPALKDSIAEITKDIGNLKLRIRYVVETIQIGITQYNPLVTSETQLTTPLTGDIKNINNTNVQLVHRDYEDKTKLAKQSRQAREQAVSEQKEVAQNAAKPFLQKSPPPSYEQNKSILNNQLMNIYISAVNDFIHNNKDITQADLDETFGNIFKDIFGEKPILKGNNLVIDDAILSKLSTYPSSQFVKLINETLASLGSKKNDLVNLAQDLAKNAINNLVNLAQSPLNPTIISDTANKFERAEQFLVSKLSELEENNNKLFTFKDKPSEESVTDPNFLQQVEDFLADEPTQKPQLYLLNVSYKKLVPDFKDANDFNLSVYIKAILQSQTKLEKSENDILSANKAKETLDTISSSSGKLEKDEEKRGELLNSFVNQITRGLKNKNDYSEEIYSQNLTLTKQFIDIIKSVIPEEITKQSQQMASELYQVLNQIQKNSKENKMILLKDLYLELIKNSHFRAVLEGKLLREKMDAFIKATDNLTQVPSPVAPAKVQDIKQTSKPAEPKPEPEPKPMSIPETASNATSRASTPPLESKTESTTKVKSKTKSKSKSNEHLKCDTQQALISKLKKIIDDRQAQFLRSPIHRLYISDSHTAKDAAMGKLSNYLLTSSKTPLNEILTEINDQKYKAAMKRSDFTTFFRGDSRTSLKTQIDELLNANQHLINPSKKQEITALENESPNTTMASKTKN